MTLPKGSTIAQMELLPQHLTTVNSIAGEPSHEQEQHDALWEMALKAEQLNDAERKQLFTLIKEYQDVFVIR